MFYTYNSLSRTAVPGHPQPPWWRRAASTNQVTLKSYLNMKTASIAHFNFRAKWHQQDHCGEVSVKPKSWVPHRFPTIHRCSGHNQVTIQGVNMLWIWSFKKVTKNNILYMHYHPTETLLYNIQYLHELMTAIKHLKDLMQEAPYNPLILVKEHRNSYYVSIESMCGAIWLVTGPLHYGGPEEI